MYINKILLGLGVLSVIVVFCLTGCERRVKTKPNIIYILMNDLGYGELESFGQRKIETPNLDALRAEGMVFTQHYSGAPMTIPSRCVLMTGLHTGHSQIRGNDQVESRGPVWNYDSLAVRPELLGQLPLKAGTMTLGRMMQSVGYRTACVGLWGLGYPGSEGVPNKQGFDFFFGYNCLRMACTYFPPFLWKNDQRVSLGNLPLDPWKTKLDEGADPYNERSYDKFTQRVYANDVICDEVLNFVDENKDKPFFMIWATPLPHASLQASEDWVRYYQRKFGAEEPYLGDKGYFPCPYPRATYAAMVSYFDEQVGYLVDKLKQDGIYENTIIIFASDNGPSADGGTDSPWFNSGGVLKSGKEWGKYTLHEGGIRVPMIVCWPEKIEGGLETDYVCAFQDVMPTLAEITGAECPPTDGISFLPTLLDENQKEHDYLYFECPENGGSKAIRQGDMKLLITNIMQGSPKTELFDLSQDIQEENDISAAHPDVVKRLKQLMKSASTESEYPQFRIPLN